VLLDAIVLAGGRSARLGGEPKAALVREGRTLLASTVEAVEDARRTVVVGSIPANLELPDAVLRARESPPFGGPAAGIRAGWAALDAAGGPVCDFVLVLACDMPSVRPLVDALLGWAGSADPGGWSGAVAVDAAGVRQPLAAVYRWTSLTEALARYPRPEDVTGLPVRALTGGLRLASVHAPPGSTDDVDTWEDAARLGVHRAAEQE
jgi:molybdopterin-guanine dinucleotide biosynthesis protein A